MSNADQIKLSYVKEETYGLTPTPVEAQGSLTMNVNPTGEKAAQGTLTMDTDPSNGDTITIDNKVYTFLNILDSNDGSVEIDLSLAQTQVNLENAINLTGTPGIGYGLNTQIHPSVSIGPFNAVNPDEAILSAKVPGAAGNNITLSETFSSSSNQFDASTLGNTTLGTDSDTLTLDTKVYTFQNTLIDVDGHIQIGASITDTQNNLIAAINNDAGTPGLDYATSNTEHPTVIAAGFVSNISVIRAKEPGSAGNLIATTSIFGDSANYFDADTLGQTQLGKDVKLKRLRMTSESLGQETNTTVSNEIRNDRQITDLVRTSINASGDQGIELSSEAYDDLLEGALFSSGWSNQTIQTKATYSMQASDNSINDSDLGFVLEGFQAYQWIKIEGFVNAENNGTFKILSVTPGKMILSGITDVVDEEDLGVAAQGTLTLDIGPTDGDTFTIDSKIYTLVDTLEDTDGYIQIGISLAQTQTNITSAINLTGIPGVDYATSMKKHTSVTIGSFVSDQAIITAQVAGVEGNNIPLMETFTDPSNQFDGSTLGNTTLGSGNADSVTLTMGESIANGVTLSSFSIEEEFTDLDSVFDVFPGVVFDQFNLNVTAEQIITGGFSILGKQGVDATESIGNVPSQEAPTHDVMSAIENVNAIIEDKIKFRATSFTFSLVNNLRTRPEVGELSPTSIGAGRVNITGTLQAYFENKDLVQKNRKFNASSLAMIAQDRAGNTYIFEFPRIKYSVGSSNATGINTDVIAEMSFQAIRDPDESITMRITRFIYE